MHSPMLVDPVYSAMVGGGPVDGEGISAAMHTVVDLVLPHSEHGQSWRGAMIW